MKFGFKNFYKFLQEYCDKVGLCVTVTPTRFVYTNGVEDGVAVGLINYPRFPSLMEDIEWHATTLASELMLSMKQLGVSVVFPDDTIWIHRDPE